MTIHPNRYSPDDETGLLPHFLRKPIETMTNNHNFFSIHERTYINKLQPKQSTAQHCEDDTGEEGANYPLAFKVNKP